MPRCGRRQRIPPIPRINTAAITRGRNTALQFQNGFFARRPIWKPTAKKQQMAGMGNSPQELPDHSMKGMPLKRLPDTRTP